MIKIRSTGIKLYQTLINRTKDPKFNKDTKGPCGSFVECKTGFDPNFAKPSSRHRVDQFGSKWICK